MNSEFFYQTLSNNASNMQEAQEASGIRGSEDDVTIRKQMVVKLYESITKHADIEFDDLPNTKGDITKSDSYMPTVEALKVLEQLTSADRDAAEKVKTVRTALDNIINHRTVFEHGYTLDNKFIQLQYQVLSTSVVASTALLVVSYVDYIKNPGSVTMVLSKSRRVSISMLKTLDHFNRSVSNGEFDRHLNAIGGRQTGFMASVMPLGNIPTTAAIILVIIGSIALIRELVFILYYYRMSLSEYTKTLRDVMEMNRMEVNTSSNFDQEEKNKITERQTKVIKSLDKLYNKLSVRNHDAEQKANRALKEETSNLSLRNLRGDASRTDYTTGIKLF